MVKREPNVYTPRWFSCFHLPISEARTKLEVEFVCSVAPLPRFRRVADICCGNGRHTRALAERGYAVTGFDRDAAMLESARELGGGRHYVQADLRDLRLENASFDLAIVMGQSFGHFDATANEMVLGRLVDGLDDGGRIILDLWNPDFFSAHQGNRDFDLPNGVTVHESKRVEDGRLFVTLKYPDGEKEDFEWQLFNRQEMEAIAKPLGLRLVWSTIGFDGHGEVPAANPRLEFVLERAGT